MRRNFLLSIALCAILALGGAAIVSAASTTIRAGNLVLTFGGNVNPKKLPKRNFTPVGLNVFGKIATTDATHPSAFRETVVDIDRNGRIDARGAPVCKGGQLTARTTAAAKRVCGKATVGSGSTVIEIAFAEQRPIQVKAPLTLFNGGVKGGKTTMFLHTFITVPVPAAVVTTITVQRTNNGRFGNRAVARVPKIAGGNGSVLSFNFNVFRKSFNFKGRRHGYLEARCPDGKFQTRVRSASFQNETGEAGVAPRTTLRGSLLVPCTPRR